MLAGGARIVQVAINYDEDLKDEGMHVCDDGEFF